MPSRSQTTPDGTTVQAGFFELRVSLAGMDPEDCLSVVLPRRLAGGTVAELLAFTFPAGDVERRPLASMFDLRANPDLPEIYAVFLDAFDAWRQGRCVLSFSSGDGLVLDLSGLVSDQLEAALGGRADPLSSEKDKSGGRLTYPGPQVHVEQRYSAVDHAPQMGVWRNKEELLEWLQSLTVLYFLDKHGAEIPTSMAADAGSPLKTATDALLSQGLIAIPLDDSMFAISAKGRGHIGRLLTETESYIDRYDHFKDTLVYWDQCSQHEDELDPEAIRFGTGQGVDLRVQVFGAEGLDPIRTVFLLRLYDGTMDEFVSTWQGLMRVESFFDAILEPVLDRSEADEAVIGRIVESGYAYLEERAERAKALRSEQEIIDSVWARPEPGSGANGI